MLWMWCCIAEALESFTEPPQLNAVKPHITVEKNKSSSRKTLVETHVLPKMTYGPEKD